MLVSGIWHGAGWQFVVFGFLHGVFLVVAHAWRRWKVRRSIPLESTAFLRIVGAVLLTYLCSTIALIFFRADSVGTAVDVLRGMTGLNGVTLPHYVRWLPGGAEAAEALGLPVDHLQLFNAWLALRILIFLGIVWGFPNVYQWLRDYPTALGFEGRPSRLDGIVSLARWRPAPAFGLIVGTLAVLALLYTLAGAPTEFLYFHF
jgi:hypothetical protein